MSEMHQAEDSGSSVERMMQSKEDLAFCYDALYLADMNNDNMVNRDEFVTFAQIMGPTGFLPNANVFQDLPLILQSNFIILSCLCLQMPTFDGGNVVDPQCCAVNPHIDVDGSQPGEIPTSQQSQYLYQVCFLTETSIERLLLSETPTTEPTKKIIPTSPPSMAPTNTPTNEPSDEPTNTPTVEPTAEPTEMPTDTPSAHPTAEPTGTPTAEPTSKPTDEPSPELSDQPTDTPTKEPTEKPSGEPSGEPTKTLTDEPTISPTVSPTLFPTTSEPSMRPTTSPTEKVEPTVSPTVQDINVTPVPTQSPTVTSVPTPSSVVEVAIAKYGIAIADGKTEEIPQSSYESDLIESMNIVAEDVADDLNSSLNEGDRLLQEQRESGTALRRSLQQNHRKLESSLAVKLPTVIDDIAGSECPSFVPPNDECKAVTASVELDIAAVGINSSTDIKNLFEERLNSAIENGALQAALVEVNPNSVVSIINGAAPGPPTPTASPVTLTPTTVATVEPVPISPGGIAGLVLAGIGGLIIGFLIITYLRRRGATDGGVNAVGAYAVPAEESADVEEALLKNTEAQEIDLGSREDSSFDKDEKYETLHSQMPTIVDSGPPMVDTGTVATAAFIGTGGALAAAAALESNDNQASLDTSPGKKKRASGNLYGSDEASSAGESGWSSNQDGSSANTSMDASLDSIPQSAISGVSPVVLGDIAAVGRDSETVDQASPSPASPERLQVSTEEEQVNYVSQSLSPTNTISPENSRSAQSQTNSQENQSYTGTTGTEGSIQSTYSELDEAIQKGDWAAVGVTAALLASQAYGEESTQGSSKNSSVRFIRKDAPLDPERAAELDLLVESGDWEGVVAAAAKFDAQEALRGDPQSPQNSAGSAVSVSSAAGSNNSSALSGSVDGSSNGTIPSNMSGSQTIDTTTSPSTYTATGLTATSDTASTRSKARKLNEIRDEVEALVNAVVPEEAENIDEMMTQFRGREEELVETLRSMQERLVAQKARKESQKQAKRQAKEYVQDKKKQESAGDTDVATDAADDMWIKEIEGSSGAADALAGTSVARGEALETPFEVDEDAEAKAMKTQLKEAISNEDWENVAEAAAGLSSHAFKKPGSSQDSRSEASNRSVDINALVDEGDWDGVVAAASKYREAASTPGSSSNAETDIPDDSTIERRRKRREERLKEEEEALAQAQIWDAIADQTKVDNKAEGSAAGLAADWAIDQSLAALKKAEEEGDEDSQESDEDQRNDNESL
ncbi:unnamed protein product [Pseudo-nitzschia multistriata]|uniref:EF-hand domain-containing protein n=1 Tax=Pseudo-nitzschia multistriata TaxID=183589 RepID=A0A448ZMQ6_9STRA|nr:unnamed protein product [Pseudo-nitzschia multistriata]